MFVNQSKIAWGMSMLLLQFGARYVLGDLGRAHEVLLSHEVTKKMVVMAMFFVATRDIVVSFVLTIAYIVIVDGILHEDRKFSLIPNSVVKKGGAVTNEKDRVPEADYKKAKEIVRMYEAQNNVNKVHDEVDAKDISYLNYVANITLAKAR